MLESSCGRIREVKARTARCRTGFSAREVGGRGSPQAKGAWRMFDGWDDFFLMAGSAAAVLIGLIFVVITLMQGRSRSSVLAGSRLYMGPIVLKVSFVLALSAAALTPGIHRGSFVVITAAVAL